MDSKNTGSEMVHSTELDQSPQLFTHTADSKRLDPEAVDVSDYDSTGSISKEQVHELFDKVQRTVEDHQFDLNFPPQLLDRARSLLDNETDDQNHKLAQHNLSQIKVVQQLTFSSSPYPEVSALVPATDDPTEPVNTFRVWFLGTIFTFLGSGINEFFSNRIPGIWINTYTAQLLSYPCGVAMARFLPTRSFTLFGWSLSLNPGPFNQKEHILIAAMANATFSEGVYVTSVFTVLKLDYFFGEKVMSNSAAFRILLALSTQLLGFGCAGVVRGFLVYPPAMIWPSSLGQIALNRALHNDNGDLAVPGWKITRFRFMLYCFIGMFVYFWLPDYLFQALSTFNWLTWISPNNVTLALVTGSLCGLGLNPWPTFDWNVASYLLDPIITPFFSTLNITFGLGMCAFFIVPLLYWNNVFNTAYISVTSNHLVDNTGNPYNVSKVLTPNYKLNVAGYEAYGAPYMGAGLFMFFATGFAVIPALICHVLLYNWRELKTSMQGVLSRKNARTVYTDIHNKLMRAYPEAPEWWYAIVLAISFTMICVVCAYWPTGLPIWLVVVVIAYTLILQIPVGILLATTNVTLMLNVLSEIIVGYAVPNNPIAHLIFKSLGTQGCAQSITFLQDLKMGHYLKVPPRTMFVAQVYASIIGTFAALGVNAWQINNIKDFCQPDQPAHFTCPGNNTFFSSAIIWGVVGPKRLFGWNGYYSQSQWAWLIGAVLPIPFWFLGRRFPKSWIRYVHIPLIIHGFGYISPFAFSYMWPTCIFGFVFNYYIKRRYRAWWLKYAYVLSSSFSVGIAVSAIVIFWAVQFHNVPLSWWGNNVPYAGVDGGAENTPTCVLRILAAGEKFPGT